VAVSGHGRINEVNQCQNKKCVNFASIFISNLQSIFDEVALSSILVRGSVSPIQIPFKIRKVVL